MELVNKNKSSQEITSGNELESVRKCQWFGDNSEQLLF